MADWTRKQNVLYNVYSPDRRQGGLVEIWGEVVSGKYGTPAFVFLDAGLPLLNSFLKTEELLFVLPASLIYHPLDEQPIRFLV